MYQISLLPNVSTGGNAFPIPWMKASTGGNAPASPLLIGYLRAGAKRPSRHGIVADHVVRLVAQVHDFGLQAEGALPQLERPVDGELLLGVARDEVLRHVLRQRVTVAHRRERPAEVQPACFQRGCDRPGVFCRIGNLVSIYFRAALGAASDEVVRGIGLTMYRIVSKLHKKCQQNGHNGHNGDSSPRSSGGSCSARAHAAIRPRPRSSGDTVPSTCYPLLAEIPAGPERPEPPAGPERA